MKRSKKAGLPPGTLMHIGTRRLKNTVLHEINYSPGHLTESYPLKPGDLLQDGAGNDGNTWINVSGLHDVDFLQSIGEQFNIHKLVLEDVVNTDQRPKMEDHGHFLFFTLKMFSWDEAGQTMAWEQLSIILGEGFIITFQEAQGDVFEPVRDRLRQAKGRIRKMGPDYLCYALLDAIVDQFFLIQEKVSDSLDGIEEMVFDHPGKEAATAIHEMKRMLLNIRRAAWPMRELISHFEKSESPLLDKGTRLYVRDVYDHSIQIIDNVEVSREITAGLMDMYLSAISNRTNEVMKVLTIVATLFIPLTFIVGIYGMNFEYMPELSWPWAYPVILGIMFFILIGMILYFRKRKWL